jgi:cytochrome c peroxidase
LFNPSDGLLYVALSTKDQVAVIDVATANTAARVLTYIKTGPFPHSLALLPSGEVLVVCRYEAALGVIPQYPHRRVTAQRYRRIPAGPLHGLRGVAVHPQAAVAYVASPAAGGVLAVTLLDSAAPTLVRTGGGPRTVRVVPDPRAPSRSLLLCANFLGRTVTVHALLADGRIGERLQTISTQAPVHDLLVVPLPQPTLLLLTHEDRAVDRSQPFVGGLDSVLLLLPAAPGGGPPFVDPGVGRRPSRNLGEGVPPLVKLDALAYDSARRQLAIAGAATDNVLVLTLADGAERAGEVALRGRTEQTVGVGRSPVALAFLPDGRLATADRLSDTVSLLPTTGAPRFVVVGEPRRPSEAELGELLFFSRALLPHNVATGDRSIYSCSACHDDGHIDGRLHPSRGNRFYSMTKTCRGIATTAPYLFRGDIPDLAEFAKNLVGTHAQGADVAPQTFDQYDTTVPDWRKGRFVSRTVLPATIRRAMVAYLLTIPPEPSPFVPLSATELPVPARRGLALFQTGCAGCHALVGDTATGEPIAPADLERRLLAGTVALTSRERYAVGPPSLGAGGNNPPSLRGVWDNAPYFSDGSAASLEEVLRRTTLAPATAAHDVRNSWPSPPLSPSERADLLAFLRCL